MTKQDDEIIDLKAKFASLDHQIEMMKDTLRLRDIHYQEMDELKTRIDHLEDQIAAIKHHNDKERITTSPDYPPYIPYITPVPIESSYSRSLYQKFTPT